MPLQMHADVGPWYRQPWPWLLMLGPVAVLLAGSITMWLAFSSADGLVADDYYKQGLAINQVLARQTRAAQLNLRAQLQMDAAAQTVQLRLSGTDPVFVRLHFAHATRAGHDVTLTLVPKQGVYVAAMPLPLPAGHWRVQVEDAAHDWRLAGQWNGVDTVLDLRADGL